MESPKSAKRLMTPTVRNCGRGIIVTHREVGFLVLDLQRAAARSPLPHRSVRQGNVTAQRHVGTYPPAIFGFTVASRLQGEHGANNADLHSWPRHHRRKLSI
jgi:hypothetical protein